MYSAEFDWRGDRPPGTALEDSIIYELHVKGFTKLNPGVPGELRGTYRGLAQPTVIDHLRRLEVTGPGAASCAPVRARHGAAGARATQLLGVSVDRLLRPQQRAITIAGPQDEHVVLINGCSEPVTFHLPDVGQKARMAVLVDTSAVHAPDPRFTELSHSPGGR